MFWAGLRIQRMPSEPDAEFGDPANYPYMCVASPSCHDTSTTRAWYEEDPSRRQRFTVRLFPHDISYISSIMCLSFLLLYFDPLGQSKAPTITLTTNHGVQIDLLHWRRSSLVCLDLHLSTARLRSCMQWSSSMWSPPPCGPYSLSRYRFHPKLKLVDAMSSASRQE